MQEQASGLLFKGMNPRRHAPLPPRAATGPEPWVAGEPRRPRVLIVDDNRDAADSLAMLLGLLSYEPRVAYDGQSGMEVAASFKPDIAILDISMPRMSGYELARKLRDELEGETPVLVALTALSSEEDRRAAREAGFEHHLAKPVDSASLCRLVIRILSERKH